MILLICARAKPENPEKSVPTRKTPKKTPQTPHIPCKKGVSGRGRGVTDKKVKFYPTKRMLNAEKL
jgi:hypothetical protein